MLIWFAAGSAAIVWTVFRSPAVDYRAVALGSVVGLIEVPFGSGPLQTLLCSCVALAAAMALTVGRRLRRRRRARCADRHVLHLVLNGSWTNEEIFWWPARGDGLFATDSLVLQRGIWSGVLELAGVMVALWLWSEFGLDDRERRASFLRTGQLDRSFVTSRPDPDHPDRATRS